jgi:hypothetical protein
MLGSSMIRAFLRRRMEHHLVQTAAVFPRAFTTGDDVASGATLARYAWHRAAFTACTLAAVALELVSPAAREGTT